MTWKASFFARAAAAAVLVLSILSAVVWAAELRYVTEREAAIRRDKRTYSPKVATVKEKDVVEVLETAEPWIRVSFKGVQGWLNQSSVTADANFVASGTDAARGVSASEQQAGGRGFDKMTEENLRKSKPDLESLYLLLDGIEKETYPDEQVLKFIEAGKLTGGGAR